MDGGWKTIAKIEVLLGRISSVMLFVASVVGRGSASGLSLQDIANIVGHSVDPDVCLDHELENQMEMEVHGVFSYGTRSSTIESLRYSFKVCARHSAAR